MTIGAHWEFNAQMYLSWRIEWECGDVFNISTFTSGTLFSPDWLLWDIDVNAVYLHVGDWSKCVDFRSGSFAIPLFESVVERCFSCNVCSREYPCVSNSLSLVFRHFILRFWNQIFTCESLRPRWVASFFLSVLLMYFCFWKVFSSDFRCSSEKTTLRRIPLRTLLWLTWGQRGNSQLLKELLIGKSVGETCCWQDPPQQAKRTCGKLGRKHLDKAG